MLIISYYPIQGLGGGSCRVSHTPGGLMPQGSHDNRDRSWLFRTDQDKHQNWVLLLPFQSKFWIIQFRQMFVAAVVKISDL